MNYMNYMNYRLAYYIHDGNITAFQRSKTPTLNVGCLFDEGLPRARSSPVAILDSCTRALRSARRPHRAATAQLSPPP